MADQIIVIPADDPPIIIVGSSGGVPGAQGPQGIPGPSGAGGETNGVTKTAARALSGQRVVYASTATEVDYADADTVAHGDLILGVTTTAALAAQPVLVQTFGEMTEPSWTWVDGPVFCGLNGALTQTIPPGATFIRQIGTAVAADRLFIDLRPTIFT